MGKNHSTIGSAPLDIEPVTICNTSANVSTKWAAHLEAKTDSSPMANPTACASGSIHSEAIGWGFLRLVMKRFDTKGGRISNAETSGADSGDRLGSITHDKTWTGSSKYGLPVTRLHRSTPILTTNSFKTESYIPITDQDFGVIWLNLQCRLYLKHLTCSLKRYYG